MESIPGRFLKLRKREGWTQEQLAEKLGISPNYVSLLENEQRQPSTRLQNALSLLEANTDAAAEGQSGSKVPEFGQGPGRFPEIPVIGWAHAGEAGSYEELPKDWQNTIPTECRDPSAFAVILEGESMEPKFSQGDLLILQPGKEPFSGCLAVCRFKDDGVVFRRVEFLPEEIRLIALNPSYPTTSYPREAFAWIYPLWGRWTQVWR